MCAASSYMYVPMHMVVRVYVYMYCCLELLAPNRLEFMLFFYTSVQQAMDRWDMYFKTASSESGASCVVMDLSGMLGTFSTLDFHCRRCPAAHPRCRFFTSFQSDG